MPNQTKKVVFFPNLNGIRFVAASLVIVHHIEQLKNIFGFPNYWELMPIKLIGRLGVILFFVLSGFLITYLLLVEKEVTGQVVKKDFYMRRILRIWPLYYLVVISGLFIIPSFSMFNVPNLTDSIQESFSLKTGLFLLFFPNIALILFPPVPYISQSWSVGVEEQFYLFWPLILGKFKRIIQSLLIVFLGYWLVRGAVIYFDHFFHQEVAGIHFVNRFLSSFNIDCMALGGMAAYVYHVKSSILNIVYSIQAQALSILLTIMFLFSGMKIPHPVFAFFFAIIILNAATNPKNIFKLENRVFSFLGKISYGLYMYHVFIIVALTFSQ